MTQQAPIAQCPECKQDLKDEKLLTRLTRGGWEIVDFRSVRRPGEIYPETRIKVGDQTVVITGVVAKVRIEKDQA